jgi:catechol-2,3-dioxygenase
MALLNVKRVSHVGLNVRDVQAQEAFYTEFVGLERTARDDDGRVYLRCNDRHHAVVLIPSPTPGLDHFALEVDGPESVAGAAEALRRAAIPHQGPAGHEPGHGPSVRLRDPNGLPIELVGALAPASPRYGPRAVQPRKLGHLTLLVRNAKRTAAFYAEVLGFRPSDWVAESFVWMRCNPDHHGLAFAEAGGKVALHHMAFEVLDFADLAHQADHLMRHGFRLLYGPGRHGPGNNQFEYFRDPEGNIIEFTCGVQQIWNEETYVPKVWDPRHLWVNMWGPDPPADFLVDRRLDERRRRERPVAAERRRVERRRRA